MSLVGQWFRAFVPPNGWVVAKSGDRGVLYLVAGSSLMDVWNEEIDLAQKFDTLEYASLIAGGNAEAWVERLP